MVIEVCGFGVLVCYFDVVLFGDDKWVSGDEFVLVWYCY